jgi:hypothetical protein
MAEVSPGPKRNKTRDDNDRRGAKEQASRAKAASQKPGFRADADTHPMYGTRGW